MEKYAVFVKVKEHLYRLSDGSDDSIFTLFMFLGDGLYKDTYFEFLHDKAENEFYGNVSGMKKEGNQVTVFLYDDLIPDVMPFTTSIENLFTIIKEWDRLRLEQVDTINLKLTDDVLTMVGV